jgi:hypothetical protein
MSALLAKHDVIVPTKRNYYIESNYDHYVHAHPAEPLDKTREIIAAKDYPDYLPAFDMMMKRRSAHMFNMFVMKKEQFDAYCDVYFWRFEQAGRDKSTFPATQSRTSGSMATFQKA